MLLRRYHKKREILEDAKEEVSEGTNFITDIEEANGLALKENNIKTLEGLKVEQLKDLAKEKGIEGYSRMKKEDLIAALAGE